MPVGNANGENISITHPISFFPQHHLLRYSVNQAFAGSRQVYILRFGRASGLISPNRTTYSDCSLAAKLKNLDRLIFPIGSSNALRRAGAIGERGSTTILSSERRRSGGLVGGEDPRYWSQRQRNPSEKLLAHENKHSRVNLFQRRIRHEATILAAAAARLDCGHLHSHTSPLHSGAAQVVAVTRRGHVQPQARRRSRRRRQYSGKS